MIGSQHDPVRPARTCAGEDGERAASCFPRPVKVEGLHPPPAVSSVLGSSGSGREAAGGSRSALELDGLRVATEALQSVLPPRPWPSTSWPSRDHDDESTRRACPALTRGTTRDPHPIFTAARSVARGDAASQPGGQPSVFALVPWGKRMTAPRWPPRRPPPWPAISPPGRSGVPATRRRSAATSALSAATSASHVVVGDRAFGGVRGDGRGFSRRWSGSGGATREVAQRSSF